MLSKEILWHFQECQFSEKLAGCFSPTVLWMDKAMPFRLYSYQQMKTTKHSSDLLLVFSLPRERNFMQAAPTRMSILLSLFLVLRLSEGTRERMIWQILFWGWAPEQAGITIKKIWWARSFLPFVWIWPPWRKMISIFSTALENLTLPLPQESLTCRAISLHSAQAFPCLPPWKRSPLSETKHINSIKAVMVAIPY